MSQEINRTYLLTHQAFTGITWFEQLPQEEQAQAIEEAVVFITSRFATAQSQSGGYPSWQFLQDRLGVRNIKKFEEDWTGKKRFASYSPHTNPLWLVYVTMQSNRSTLEETKKALTPAPLPNRRDGFNPGLRAGGQRHFGTHHIGDDR